MNNPFIINLIRFGRKERYAMRCGYHAEIVNNIKKVPYQYRDYNDVDKNWNITAVGLSILMKMFNGRKDIKFVFEDDNQRTQYINIINKHRNKEQKDKEARENLEQHNENIIAYREDLEVLIKHFNHEPYLKKGVVPMKHQVYGALFAKKLLEGDNNCLLAMDLGTGKAQSLDSLILTPKGYKRMGDMEVGDQVINSDGKTSKVTGVFPQGKKEMYEITFTDKTKTISCGEHLWKVQSSNHRKRNHGWFTYTLNEIIEMGIHYKYGNSLHNKWHIPMVKPIEFEKKEFIIDPYVLGCLLGDGCLSARDRVEFSNIDNQLLMEFSSRLPKGYVLQPKKCNVTYAIKNELNSRKDASNENIVNQEIKWLKLNGTTSHTKFIPEEYLFSSIEQRIDLLQGLMDTDGTVSMSHRYDHTKGNNITYTSVSEKLIDDISFLVQTLGGTTKKRNMKTDKNGFTSFTVTLSLNPEITPFKLDRKNRLYVPKSKYKPYRMIKEVKKIGLMEAQCISVDAHDHLYITDNCIVTHNTLTSILAVEMMPEVKKCLFIVPANLRLNIQNEIHMFTDSFCYVPKVVKGKDGYRLSKYKRNEGRELSDCKYIVLSYDYFSSSKFDCNEKILELGFHDVDLIVYDEFHNLTNKKSNRSENIKKAYGEIVKRELGLTATPLKGNLDKFFPILQKLKPLDFSNQTNYMKDICGMRYFHKLGDYQAKYHQVEEPNLKLLNSKLQTFMYRVKKEEVLKDLPPLTVSRVIIELTDKQRKEYKAIEEGFSKVDWYGGGVFSDSEDFTTSALAIMIRLRQYLASVKIEKAMEIMKELNDYGEKCILFDAFKDPIYTMKDMMGVGTEIYSGDQSTDQKQWLVDKFQDKDSDLRNLLISLMAGNSGITLTKSSNAIQTTLSLVPAENIQAWGRIHRKGQQERCTIFLPTVADTIDDLIYETLTEKSRIISAVIDGEEYDDKSSMSVSNEIINIIKEQWKSK